MIRDDVAAGRFAIVLGNMPDHALDSDALWPQTTHMLVRVAIDALAADLPQMTAFPNLSQADSASSDARRDGSVTWRLIYNPNAVVTTW